VLVGWVVCVAARDGRRGIVSLSSAFLDVSLAVAVRGLIVRVRITSVQTNRVDLACLARCARSELLQRSVHESLATW